MFWFVKATLFVAAAFFQNRLGALLRQPENETRPKPSGLSDVNVPVVEEGRAIAIAWGTVHLKSPAVLWYGKLSTQEIPDSGGWFYFLNVMYGWCHGPVDAVESFQWDGITVPMSQLPRFPGDIRPLTYPLERGATNPTEVWLIGYLIFGGSGREGGIDGRYAVHWGTLDQEASESFAEYVDEDEAEMPGYQGLFYTLTEHSYQYPGTDNAFYIGTSIYLKPHSLVVRRCPNQLGLDNGDENIDGDANPAAMLYELLTDERWGLGMDPALIDTDSFLAVGAALADEGLGLSMQFTDQTDQEEIIEEILRHIDGVRFQDPGSGLLSIALIRDDYDPEDLPHIDDDATIEIDEFVRPGLEAVSNKVLIGYVDRDQAYQAKVAIAVDLAGVQALGRHSPQDMKFYGISKASIAQQIAARELKGVSYPFASIRLVVNRTAQALRPGSPFLFSSAALGISEMVCRVTRIAFGPIDDGRIRLEAVEDAFGVDWTAYAPPAPSQWVEPEE